MLTEIQKTKLKNRIGFGKVGVILELWEYYYRGKVSPRVFINECVDVMTEEEKSELLKALIEIIYMREKGV